jgi:hypothetical protein
VRAFSTGTRWSGRMERNIEAVEECVERSHARVVVLSLWWLCAPSSQLLAGDRLRRSSGRPVAGRTPDWTMAGSVCAVDSALRWGWMADVRRRFL